MLFVLVHLSRGVEQVLSPGGDGLFRQLLVLLARAAVHEQRAEVQRHNLVVHGRRVAEQSADDGAKSDLQGVSLRGKTHFHELVDENAVY